MRISASLASSGTGLSTAPISPRNLETRGCPGGGCMMALSVGGIEARLLRMERLTRGLAKEIDRVTQDQGVLLYLEKRAYVHALRDAWAGVESARVILSVAVSRLRGDAARTAEKQAGPSS